MDQTLIFDILHSAHHDLECPVCGRQFSLEEIKIRGSIDKNFLIQVSCHRGHAPSLILYVVQLGQKNKDIKRISPDDVIDLHQALQNFQGDFKSIFQKLETKKSS
ncbi:hypothetical protein HYW32_04370 [Candidatus Berkelbacteria bacterium]|nr:hypothetical protein [Candidatus Berkelbacteria bacterium]